MCVLVTTKEGYLRQGLYIRILLISSFLLIPIVKNVLENSKISRTAESSNRYNNEHRNVERDSMKRTRVVGLPQYQLRNQAAVTVVTMVTE